jgi:hypothetical protein
MNRSLADRVANAVLYEGYVLYPYRPSVKNRQRWTFGGLFPEPYCRQTGGSESSENRTECLVRGTADAAVEVIVRFLHLTARQVGAFDPPLAEWPEGEPPFRPVEVLRVGHRTFHTWQEAEEREVRVGEVGLGAIRDRPHRHAFSFPGRRWLEPIPVEDRTITGVMVREQQAIAGAVEVSAVPVGDGLFRLTVTVRNLTPLQTPTGRDEAVVRSLVSTHLLLGVRRGGFVSLLDPPDDCREAAAGCRNVGVWPVLIGEDGQTDTVLSSPIILYDYPRVAPESPGDLFDGTEIDEILSLRILTLTDEEKRDAAAVDERARALLTRTEALGAEELLGLHGTIRNRSGSDSGGGRQDTGSHDSGSSLPLPLFRVGDQVRLRPRGRADVFDIALAGMIATVEAVEQDFEGRVYLAVTVDDDPGQDLGRLRQPGHRFFFAPEEVEPLARGDCHESANPSG